MHLLATILVFGFTCGVPHPPLADTPSAETEAETQTIPVRPQWLELTKEEVLESAVRNDSDNDGFNNLVDLCAAVYNPDQLDTDKDLVGDACDECPTVPGYETITGCPDEKSPCDDVTCAIDQICLDGACDTKPVAPEPSPESSRPGRK